MFGIGLYIFTKEEWGGANRVLCNWDGVIAEGREGGDNKVICHGHTHTLGEWGKVALFSSGSCGVRFCKI